jgi:microcystin synthetase protein McyG
LQAFLQNCSFSNINLQNSKDIEMTDFNERISKLSPKKLALLAMDLKKRADLAEAAQRTPIAVIGIGCRFPGGVADPQGFWSLLQEGKDAIGEVPADRWDIDAYYDPDPDAPGKMNTRYGGFVEDVEKFDPHFFGIAPREALSMDPQQRLLLEVSWEALENAGIAAERLVESSTGVFVGISSHDYFQYRVAGNPAAFDAYSASGGSHAITSGRLSYFLGTRGPSLAIDTACSSSLVSVHLACLSLRTGECDMALAGGVNLILGPDTTIMLSKSGMMAGDGRCKTFDASADGFVRGEGCGIVVLKPLDKALADGDRILAIIAGTAINQDGRSNGLTAPHGPAQEAVIRAALKNAGVEPSDVGFVETHGTGTSLGDPIEVQALAAVFGEGRHPENPLAIGSLKTNIGHLESAAGVAGLIKAILVLQHQEIPPHLHFRKPNPHLNWEDLPLVVPTKCTPWIALNGKRIAGVSSFGFSGTNVHIVVKEAPAITVAEKTPERPLHILTLSAKNMEALKASARRYVEALSRQSAPVLKNVCHTANTGRSHFRSRLAVAAGSEKELLEKLAEFTADRQVSVLHAADVRRRKSPEIVFLFTGQGSQYVGMGRQLYETQPVFRQALERCDATLQPYLGQTTADILYPEQGISPLDQTAFTQPLLFAFEWALSEMWQSWGVTPSAVIGHSLGEYVAACVAGIFSLEDGLRLVAERGRLIQDLPEGGGMAAIFAGKERVEKAIRPYHDRVSIAAFNSPDMVVISGDRTIVAKIGEELALAGIGSKTLVVSHAFHSPLVDPMLQAFEEKAKRVTYFSPRIPFVSNVDGEIIAAGNDFPGAQYWRRHVRQPVRFASGIQKLYGRGYRIFLEIGPSPVLSGLGGQCLPNKEVRWLPSLRPGREDWEQLLDSLGALYVQGVTVDWAGFDRPYARHKVVLPTYSFQRQPFWIEKPGSSPPEQDRLSRKEALSAPHPSPDEMKDVRVDSGNEGLKDWLYQVQWRPKERIHCSENSSAAEFFPDLSAVSAALESEVEQLAQRHELSVYNDMLPRLDALCTSYILKAFHHLGWHPLAGVRYSNAGLMAKMGIQDIHMLLFNRLVEVLEEDGYLRRIDSDWEACDVPAFADPQQRLTALMAQFPQCGPEINMVGQCGNYLADVLKGERDPLELLFPAGSLENAEKLYQNTPSTRFFNTLVRRAVDEALQRLPSGKPVRILELGAGTGGSTSYVLPAIPTDRAEYVFTDVSKMFTSKAAEKFKSYKNVTYRILDISEDPAAQGFPLHHYDLILAANVLHATKNIGKTLENVQSLLASEGMLIVLEATGKTRLGDLTVGLTEGWWHFSDRDLRPSYALLSKNQWLDLLTSKGFEKALGIVENTWGLVALSEQTILLAQGPHLDQTVKTKKEAEGLWLVFNDSTGIGDHLCSLFREKGEQYLVVTCGERFRQVDESTWEVNPRTPESYSLLLGELMKKYSAPIKGIIFLWALDVGISDDISFDLLDEIQEKTCGSVLSLVQALIRAGRYSALNLWLVTEGVHRLDEEADTPAVFQSPLWGLGKVIALEHPELGCVGVDLDPGGRDESAGDLFKELISHDGEHEIVFRGGSRYVSRLHRYSTESLKERCISGGPAVFLKENGCYLITGGLSGLGLLVAQWMVDNGAKNLVLVGRSVPSPSTRKVLDQLEDAGARVVVARKDVSRSDEMKALFTEMKTSLPPLRGVVHCAGILDDGILLSQTWKRFSRVMAPKVKGSWLLHTLTRTMDLDFFILFSSGASMLGSSGQSNHAAANTFLDALAFYRQAQGLPAQSINWGAWSDVGSLVTHDVAERIELAGMDAISPRKGILVFEYLLHRLLPRIGVFPLNWPRFFSQYLHGIVPLFYSEFASEQQFHEAEKFIEADSLKIVECLEDAPPGSRWDLLCEWTKKQALKVLGLDSSGTIDIQQPLKELGLDSLMAVELRNALGEGLGQTLPATLLFDYPSVEEVTGYLAKEILFLEPAGGASYEIPQKIPERAYAESDMDGLTTDDIAALLEEKLINL